MKKTPKMFNAKLLSYLLKNLRAYFIVYTILLFISYPLTIIIWRINNSASINAIEPYALIIVSMFLAVFTPFILFSYLNSKKSVDVYHALPIKRSSLFGTHVFASLLLLLIPFTLNFFIGYGLNAAFGFNFLSRDLLYYFVYIVALIAIHGLPLLVIMNTGTTADGLIHTGILILLPFVAYAAFNTFFQSYVYGAGFLPWDYYKYLTPLAALFQPLVSQPESLMKLTFYWIVMSIMLYLASLQLYALRKSEKAEEPFVNEKYFPIVMTMFIPLFFILMNVTTRSFTSSNSLKDFFSVESFILPFGIGFVGYMILNFFRYRSTKYFMKTLMRYVMIIMATSMVAVTIIVSDGFGAAWRIPEVDDIESIAFDTRQLHQINSIFTPNEDLYEHYDQKVHLIEEASIAKFVKIHQDLNEILKEDRFDEQAMIEKSIITQPFMCAEDYQQFLTFTYHLKSGRKIEKILEIPTELMTNFAQMINDKNYQIITNPILNQDISTKEITLFDNMMSKNLGSLQKTDVNKLQEAYFNDLAKLSSDDLMFKPSQLKYIINYHIDYDDFKENTQGVNLRKNTDYDPNYTNFLFIDDRFPETVQYLASIAQYQADTQNTYMRLAYADMAYTKQENQSFCGLISQYYLYDEALEIIEELDAFKDKIEGSYIREPQDALYIEGLLSLPLAP